MKYGRFVHADNHRNNSVIVDFAVGQIPRSTERISSFSLFSRIIRTFVFSLRTRRCSPAVDPIYSLFVTGFFSLEKMDVVHAELIMMILVIYIRVRTAELLCKSAK